MSRTRDVIQEIAQVRKRRRFGSTMAELPSRLFALERAFAEHAPTNVELTRYFPVALVACIEGYFRLAIKELVDAGEPYISHAEKTASGLKLDFAVVRAVHGKAVTIGELIGHSVSLSRLEHIESVMTGLLGDSFLNRLRAVSDRWAHEVRGEPITPMLKDAGQVFVSVTKAFELRHIVCHELATAHDVDHEEVARCFDGCVAFLRAADELLSQILHPGAPLTQADINFAAGQSLAEARVALQAAVSHVQRRLSGDDLVAFNAAHASWEQFCCATSDFDALQVRGGSMWAGYRSSCEEALVRSRTTELLLYRRIEESAEGET